MSRFKTTTIDPNNVGSWIERRRKGRMIRKQHTVTGKWTPWMIDPNIAAYQPLVEALSILDDARKRSDANLDRMTVAELRSLAGDRGIKVPSKARKSDIITALTGE